jgi:hypothetical protein
MSCTAWPRASFVAGPELKVKSALAFVRDAGSYSPFCAESKHAGKVPAVHALACLMEIATDAQPRRTTTQLAERRPISTVFAEVKVANVYEPAKRSCKRVCLDADPRTWNVQPQ